MGHKSIKYVALYAGLMAIAVALVALARELRALSLPAGARTGDSSLVLVALAFGTICLLAGMAASTLKAQAAEIAHLERRLAAGQQGH